MSTAPQRRSGGRGGSLASQGRARVEGRPTAVRHSLRVGSAQSLAAAGALQTAGDWDSPSMPARYARHQLAARGASSLVDGPPDLFTPI